MNNLKNLLILLIALSPAILIAQANEEITKELTEILQARKFDEKVLQGKATSVSYAGYQFGLDKEGTLYLEGPDKKQFPVEIYADDSKAAKTYLIFDPSKPPSAGLSPNPFSTCAADDEQLDKIDDLGYLQRLYGIHTIKSKNPECYFAYAKERIPGNALERILALERAENSRPLAFENDEDWNSFKTELQDIFKPLGGENSFIAVLGSSTTFFSENPKKGKTSLLFESEPECIERATDPEASRDVYTFDNPGSDRSDLDIDFLIPELSDLCDKADVFGNDGLRDVYLENSLDQCLRASSDETLKSLVTKTKPRGKSTLYHALVPNKPLANFLDKWTNILKRPINLSVLIRPDERKGSKEKDVKDFSEHPYIRSRFLIPIK